MPAKNRLAEYYFWKYQYTSRNEEFRYLADSLMISQRAFFASLSPDLRSHFEWNKLSVDSLEVDPRCLALSDIQRDFFSRAKQLEAEICSRFSVLPHFRYVDSNHVLRWAIEGDFEHTIIESARVWTPWTGLNVIEHNLGSSDTDYLSLSININGDIQSILQEVGRLCEIRKLKEGHKQQVDDESVDFNDPVKIIKSLKKKRPEIPVKDFKHLSRVVGLWLWDRKVDGDESVAEYARQLKKISGVDILGFGGSSRNTFNRLHNRTDECVQQAEVLHMG